MSDYAPGTRLRPVMVNITFADNLTIDHVGVGYHIVLPSGRVHDGGYTWHSPAGNYAQAPPELVAELQHCMDALLKAAADHEGVDLPIGRS